MEAIFGMTKIEERKSYLAALNMIRCVCFLNNTATVCTPLPIISRGLYIFYHIFSAVYNQKGFISQTIYVLNKEIWAKNLVYNQKQILQVIMACVWYIKHTVENESIHYLIQKKITLFLIKETKSLLGAV